MFSFINYFQAILPEFHLLNYAAIVFVAVVLGVLALLSIGGQFLKRQPESKFDPAIVRKFNQRVNFWFLIIAVLVIALQFGKIATVTVFGLISFWALREFITMTPTRRGDHRTLFWVLIGFTPAQYILVAWNWFDMFTILIPVYASLFIPGRIAFTGERERFLERCAKIQFGLLICVYCLSHAAALLNLELLTRQQGVWVPWDGPQAGLLIFLLVIVQVSDSLYFVWDRLFGKHVIAVPIDPNRTWEGLIGSTLSCGLVGIAISFFGITPFSWYGAALLAMLISVMGSSGSMTMSAIKRDHGVKDYGTLVQGHAGILDRIDSICFAAPMYFHVVRMFLNQ